MSKISSRGKNPLRVFLTEATIYLGTCPIELQPSLFSTVSELERIVSTDNRSKRKAKDHELLLELQCSSLQNVKKLEQLIKEGANVNYNPLHLYLYDPCLTAFLLKHGAHVNALEPSGSTALHIAARNYYWHEDIIPMLLFYNADTSIRDQHGNTPIMYLMKEDRSIGEKNLALLFEYEYDFSCVNEAGSSLLALAMITKRQHFIDDIIERGGNFSTLSGDFQVLMWCISQPDPEEFKWFWNVFNYKDTWFFKQPILHHLLKQGNYEAFDFVIKSPKLEDVLDIWYGDHDCKEGTVLGSLERWEEVFMKFTLIDILDATTHNYNHERAKPAIYRLLRYGYKPSEHEVLEIYKVLGDRELFDLFLSLDISERSDPYSFSSLVPKILLNPDMSGQDFVNKCVINSSDFRRESLMATTPHIYDYWTNQEMRKIYNSDREMLDQQSPGRVPRLLELSRNQSLLGIWKKYKIRKRSHFGSVLRQIPIATGIKDLILFKSPIYRFNLNKKRSPTS